MKNNGDPAPAYVSRVDDRERAWPPIIGHVQVDLAALSRVTNRPGLLFSLSLLQPCNATVYLSSNAALSVVLCSLMFDGSLNEVMNNSGEYSFFSFFFSFFFVFRVDSFSLFLFFNSSGGFQVIHTYVVVFLFNYWLILLITGGFQIVFIQCCVGLFLENIKSISVCCFFFFFFLNDNKVLICVAVFCNWMILSILLGVAVFIHFNSN